MNKTERNYGIDILKILLAIMVIVLHINARGTGQVLLYATESPWKQIITLVTMLCYPAVNTYVLITGYCSYEAHKGSAAVIKSLSLLWLSALFFSVIGYLVATIGFGEQFEFFELLKRFFPIVRGVWWFYTVYFALMLLSPFLNKMLDCLSTAECKLLLLCLVLMLCILPIFVNWDGALGSNCGYSLIWFITLYITGAILCKRNIIQSNNKYVLYGAACYVVITLVICIYPKVLSIIGIQSSIAMYNSFPCYLQAIALFITFGNLNIAKTLQVPITVAAGLVHASYLLHCQEDVEKLLWGSIHPSSFANSSQIVTVAMAIIVSVLVVSVALEYLRTMTCKKLKIDRSFTSLTSNIFSSIEKILQGEMAEDV